MSLFACSWYFVSCAPHVWMGNKHIHKCIAETCLTNWLNAHKRWKVSVFSHLFIKSMTWVERLYKTFIQLPNVIPQTSLHRVSSISVKQSKSNEFTDLVFACYNLISFVQVHKLLCHFWLEKQCFQLLV